MAVTDSYTKVMLHLNGTDTSTTFTDESGKTWTNGGDAQLDTAQKKFGTAALLLDGTGDYIYTPTHADFEWGTGSGTLDFWVYFNTLPGVGAYSTILAQYQDSSNYRRFRLRNNTGVYTMTFAETVSGATTISVAPEWSAVRTGAWIHVAYVKNGNDWMVFIDGEQIGTTTTDTDGSYNNSATNIEIGRTGTGSYFDGWLDEIRWSKGVARWTASFSAPEREYENISVTPSNASAASSALVSSMYRGFTPASADAASSATQGTHLMTQTIGLSTNTGVYQLNADTMNMTLNAKMMDYELHTDTRL